jgi:hypothetical protein
MAWFEANASQLMLVIPMTGVLFAVLFRLDGWLAGPGKSIQKDHRLSGWDADGNSLCVEPDGTVRNRAGVQLARRRAPRIRRRAFADWECTELDCATWDGEAE